MAKNHKKNGGLDMEKSNIRCSTSLTGVRYREHATRRFGVRKDRYYLVRIYVNGKDLEKGCGWE